MRVLLIAGARPNFMKIAPIYRNSLQHDVICKIVHTGQHYDYSMSQAFFEDLELPEPDFFLDAGSGSHATQTGKIMSAFEKVCVEEKPDLVIVVGDVNSTLACSIVAKKQMIKVAHVEAGLRSFDMTMPEEINRIVTDSISDIFFVTEESGKINLLKEGKPESAIHMVGNVMIDNLMHQVNRLNEMDCSVFETAKLKPNTKYAFLTLHRPSNVDEFETFNGIASSLNKIAEIMPIIFPVHPRTKKMISKFNIELSENIIQLSPLGFREALFLWKDASIVLTDSGGLQEETTALKVPCITLRENTERPITCQIGSNILAGNRPDTILKAFQEWTENGDKPFRIPTLWDGYAAKRIWNKILS